MAEIRVFASQALGGGKLPSRGDLDGHRGYGRDLSAAVGPGRGRRESSRLAAQLCEQDATYADVVCMGFTHLQPAEPTTLGYRLGVYAQDCLIDDTNLRFVFDRLTTKGMRGAVGTAASYEQLVRSPRRLGIIRSSTSRQSGLRAREISTQTYPRKLDYSALRTAGLGARFQNLPPTCASSAAPNSVNSPSPSDARKSAVRQCPSSAIPILCERIDSLARLLVSYSDVAWQNASTNFLERTLDDSANRRTILPEAILSRTRS